MKKIIIDTDPGLDDAMAIMLAVKSNQFDIKAFTTVCGNSTIENTTRNTRYILKLLESNIPVYSGASKPINYDLIQAVVHGESGLNGIDPTNNPELNGKAVEQIIKLVEENPYEITIITLGPLTNIALAFQQKPNIMKMVKEIVMMGGAIKVPGNKNRVAEFNIFVDPEAAKIVFNSNITKTIIPLDVCNTVLMTLKEFEKVKDPILQDPLMAMMKPYIRNIEKDTGINAALMYDPLTVFYLLSPESCKTKKYNIQIETKGEFTRGMTVADLRNVKDEIEDNCIVVEYISSTQFTDYFIDTLNK